MMAFFGNFSRYVGIAGSFAAHPAANCGAFPDQDAETDKHHDLADRQGQRRDQQAENNQEPADHKTQAPLYSHP